MSLLLDALKKAAEQKARAKEANAERDVAAAGAEADGQIEDGIGHREDSTLVSEDSTITYHEKTERIEDSTEFLKDKTDFIDEQTDFTEDGTDFVEDRTDFAEDRTDFAEDRTDFVEDRTELGEEQTEVSQQDQTEYSEDELEFKEDDTQLLAEATETQVFEATKTHLPVESGDQTEATEVVEQTEINAGDHEADKQDTEYTSTEVIIDTGDDTLLPSFDEDETMSLLSNEDVSDFLGDSDQSDLRDKSDITVEATSTGIDVGDIDTDDDLSLYLVERGPDDTTLSAETETESKTETPTGNAHVEILSSNIDTEGLQIAEHGDELAGQDQTATSTTDENPTVTTGIKLESLRHEHTIVRPEATSTHTYAPDNYDRTLIRPPSDDASRIFAGMKSEEDVLMTPDYAKRVFLSKSSANRVQHYKVYLGIAISILLAVGIFSLFQLQDEYNRIDLTLMPLKRDPMPGIVKTANMDDKSNLFEKSIQPDADTKTLKIVENAGLLGTSEEIVESNIAEESSQAETSSSSEAESDLTAVSDQTAIDLAEETQVATVVSQQADTISDQAADNQVNIMSSKTAAKPETTQQTSSNLQITSNSRFEEKDQLLAEAFAAYQKGDDKTALQKYASVLKIDSTNRNALLARAAIAVQNGDNASAIKDYQHLLLANPKDSLAMSSFISVAKTAPDQSESQLKLMIRDEPDSPHLNFVLANIYSAQNRWQEAQSLYFKALENNPRDPNYAYNLAVSLEHIAKPKVAITYYERAISNFENGLATFNRDVVDNRIEMLRQL